MSRPKVAILGTNGIGKFHARDFKKEGAEVVAILGTSDESLKKSLELLESEYGIVAKGYTSLNDLINSEELDAVSVCTPSSFHYDHTKECLSSGLNVFSEKPIVQNSNFENAVLAKELIELANDKKVIFNVNTHWPSILPQLSSVVSLDEMKSFSMLMEPRDKGVDILLDQVSHMNSVLIRILPNGIPRNFKFSGDLKENIDVFFDYVSQDNICSVKYGFRYKEKGIRELGMEFNGKLFRREVDSNYNQVMVSDDIKVPIQDPLTNSIKMFVNALKGEGSPLISSDEIIKNISLQDRIVEEFLKRNN